MKIIDRFKDWHLNRVPFGATSFVGFHHVDTNMGDLLDNLSNFIHHDFRYFNSIYPIDLIRENLKPGFDLEKFILDLKKYKIITGIDFINDSPKGDIHTMGIWRDNYPGRHLTGIGLTFFNDLDTLKYSFASLLTPKNLYIGYHLDNDYINWQDRTGIENYKYRGGLKYTKDNLGRKIVDISDRPGRTVFKKHFNYCGASKIWFGPMIYQYIPQELIISFKKAIKITVLKDNITCVHLYKGIYSGDDPQNQEIQKLFREHIGIDYLEIK